MIVQCTGGATEVLLKLEDLLQLPKLTASRHLQALLSSVKLCLMCCRCQQAVFAYMPQGSHKSHGQQKPVSVEAPSCKLQTKVFALPVDLQVQCCCMYMRMLNNT